MLERIAPFLGRYCTVEPGAGICPTGVEVQFREKFALERFDDWVRYRQQAVDVATGRVLHDEAGVLRQAPDGSWELSLAMNSGRLEYGRVTWDPGGSSALRTDSTEFHRDRLGLRAMRRWFRFDAEGCDKELWLSTGVWPELQRHMWSRLQRMQ